MGLFSIPEMLKVNENDNLDNTFSQHSYINTNFFESAQEIVNDMKTQYREAYLDLHRESILSEEKPKFSKFYENVAAVFRNTSSRIKALNEKAEAQFKHYKKNYNLADVRMGGPITISENMIKMCYYQKARPNRRSKKLCSNKSNIKLLERCTKYDREGLIKETKFLKKNGTPLINNYRNKNLYGDYGTVITNYPVTNENFVSYLENEIFLPSDRSAHYDEDTVVGVARDLNDNIIANSVSNDIIDSANNIYDGAESLSGMIDLAISHEAIPFPNPEQQNDMNTRNIYATLALSQYIEQVSVDILSIGYKTDVLFEDMREYQRIVDQAVDNTQKLKESGQIGPADIILAEALCDINY